MQEDDTTVGVEDDALEYLKRVRLEASLIPLVITSGIDARAFDDNRTTSYLTDDTEDFENPPYAWMCQVIDDFMAARCSVTEEAISSHTSAAASDLPPLTDWQAWNQLISQDSFQPFSATLARMDFSLVAKCLDNIAGNMRRQHADGLHLSSHTGLWLYGLLVRLEKPIHGNLAATLREISQLSRKLRPRELNQVHIVSSSPSQVNVLIPMYDTLVVVAGGFFGQDSQLAPVVDEYVCLNHSIR